MSDLKSLMSTLAITTAITETNIARAKKTEYKSPTLKESNPKEWRKKQLQKQSRKKNRKK